MHQSRVFKHIFTLTSLFILSNLCIWVLSLQVDLYSATLQAQVHHNEALLHCSLKNYGSINRKIISSIEIKLWFMRISMIHISYDSKIQVSSLRKLWYSFVNLQIWSYVIFLKHPTDSSFDSSIIVKSKATRLSFNGKLLLQLLKLHLLFYFFPPRVN